MPAGKGDLASAQQFIIIKILEELVFDSKQEARLAWSALAALLPEALCTSVALHRQLSTVRSACDQLTSPNSDKPHASPMSQGFDALQVRRAGCIWLLSLISYTGCHLRLLPLLPTIQDAFSHLLGDRDELTQASRALPACHLQARHQ